VLKRAAPKAAPQKQRVVATASRKLVMLPRQDEVRPPATAGAVDEWSEF